MSDRMQGIPGRRTQKCSGSTCGEYFFMADCVRRGDGKTSAMPLNLQPVQVEHPRDPGELRGKFVYLVDNLREIRAAVPGDEGPFYEGHHATCPNVEEFRHR